MVHYESDVDAADAQYHGVYACPNDCGEPHPVARPKSGCQPGRCQECGTEREYVELLREVGDDLPDERSALKGTYRLTADEARAAYDAVGA